MLDVALLTKSGIVFCYIPKETLDRFRKLVKEASPDQNVTAVIEFDHRRVEVKIENILISYERGIHG